MSCVLCAEADELLQDVFDSGEVRFVREHVVALWIDESERVGTIQQLEGFQHVGEGDDLVLHSCQHAHGRGAGDSFFGVIEQVVFSGFGEEGFGEGVPLFRSFFRIVPSSDVSLLYFLSFWQRKIGQQELLREVGGRSDQQHACDVLGVSFEDMERHPSSHGGACDDPALAGGEGFLCILEDGHGVGNPVPDGCRFHGALRLSVRSVVEEDCCCVRFLGKVENARCFRSCCIGGVARAEEDGGFGGLGALAAGDGETEVVFGCEAVVLGMGMGHGMCGGGYSLLAIVAGGGEGCVEKVLYEVCVRCAIEAPSLRQKTSKKTLPIPSPLP